MLVIQSAISRLQLLLLGVRGIVVASTPARVHLHVQLLLFASHLVVFRLLRPVQRMPLSRAHHVHVTSYRVHKVSMAVAA